SGCAEFASLEIQSIQGATFVIGLLLFLFSFCNIALRLFHHKCLFYLVSFRGLYARDGPVSPPVQSLDVFSTHIALCRPFRQSLRCLLTRELCQFTATIHTCH